MKKRRLLLLSLLVVALLVGGCGLWVWHAKRQYALNRELISAVVVNDGRRALSLVNAGADPNVRYSELFPSGFLYALRERLHGSPMPEDNTPTAFLIVCGETYTSSLHYLHLRENAPEDMPLVEAMLAHGAKWRVTNRRYWTALHFAVGRGYPNVARRLLELGANVNAQESEGRTPLLYSVMNGDTRLTRLLLEHGADSNQKDGHGETPLTLAQRNHWPDIVAMLRKGAK